MIKNLNNNLYIGVTQDPQKRLFYHNTTQGAEFTKFKASFEIVFLEEYPTLAEARRREIQIKKWRREKKEILIKKYELGLNTKPTKY
jgi:putative endonuclease